MSAPANPDANPVLNGTDSTQQSGGMDAIDKGVNTAFDKAGHGGQSRGTTEKVSDGLRTAFKKATGKDVPVKDQN